MDGAVTPWFLLGGAAASGLVGGYFLGLWANGRQLLHPSRESHRGIWRNS